MAIQNHTKFLTSDLRLQHVCNSLRMTYKSICTISNTLSRSRNLLVSEQDTSIWCFVSALLTKGGQTLVRGFLVRQSHAWGRRHDGRSSLHQYHTGHQPSLIFMYVLFSASEQGTRAGNRAAGQHVVEGSKLPAGERCAAEDQSPSTCTALVWSGIAACSYRPAESCAMTGPLLGWCAGAGRRGDAMA